MIANQTENIFKPCFSCKSVSHLIDSCPFLHFIPDVDLILRKHIFARPVERDSSFKRKTRYFSHINSRKYKSSLAKMHDEFEKIRRHSSKEYETDEPYSGTKLVSSGIIEDEDNNDFIEDMPIMLNDHHERSESYLDPIEKTNKIPSPFKDNNEISEFKPFIEGFQRQFNYSKEDIRERDIRERSPKNRNHSIIIKTGNDNSSSVILHPLTKNDNFERDFLLSLYLRRKLIIKDLKLTESELKGLDLFDFAFEKPKNFNIYSPGFNFDNAIKKYQRFVRKKDKLFRSMNNTSRNFGK